MVQKEEEKTQRLEICKRGEQGGERKGHVCVLYSELKEMCTYLIVSILWGITGRNIWMLCYFCGMGGFSAVLFGSHLIAAGTLGVTCSNRILSTTLRGLN